MIAYCVLRIAYYDTSSIQDTLRGAYTYLVTERHTLNTEVVSVIRNTQYAIRNAVQQQTPDSDLAFLMAIVMAFLAVLSLCFGLLYLQQTARRNRLTTYALDIHNLGNVPTTFDIRVEERTNQLTFEVYHQHELLVEKVTTAPKARTAQTAVTAKKGSGLDTVRDATSFGQSLISLMPGPMAKPLQKMIAGASKGTMLAAQAERAGKAGSKLAKSAKGAAGAADKMGLNGSGGSATTTTGAVGPDMELEVVDRWYETPRIAPGNTLELHLTADWSRGVPHQRYPFRVLSQASQQTAGPQVSTNGALLAKESWWERALPVIIAISAVVAVALFIVIVVVSISVVV